VGELTDIFGRSPALLTDLYQLTMAYGYWKSGRQDVRAAFHVFFRRNPFGGGYTVACGLEGLIEFIEQFRYSDDDLDFLARQTADGGRPLFEPDFLTYLRELRLRVDVDAVVEGTAVFPHEPLVRVTGPVLHCQLLETPLLNLIGFPTLVATKAARICQAARGKPVIEFGLRRAQGPDGGLTASRAAYVGGCVGTSNALAGKLFGIPVKGTHAHSWVMLFDDERQAFEAYADAMPDNCLLLVDTYNSLDGVRRAIEIGRRLRAGGHSLQGIRLDSGDLAYLSIEARRLLDEAGFPEAIIVASNELDEHVIDSLYTQGARIDVWGVGTRLVTAFDEPALGAVYKLSAVQDAAGRWQYKVKLSEQTAKITTPGVLQVRRYRRDGEFLADMIYDEPMGIPDAEPLIVDPVDPMRRKPIPPGASHEDLLAPVFRAGQRVYQPPPLAAVRQRAHQQLEALHPAIRRLVNPHEYPCGLEKNLHELKTRLILQARGLAR
jgi:nicotinate phosphoribosyltransferase